MQIVGYINTSKGEGHLLVRSKNMWSLRSIPLVCIRSCVQLNDDGLDDKTVFGVLFNFH